MKKILVVDDNEINLENAVEAMKELDYEVLSASSAEEAKKIIEEISATEDLFLVLSDLNMETEDAGMDVLNFAGEKCIPCVIVTGGQDHGRPAVGIWHSPYFMTFKEIKKGENILGLGSVLGQEKTKEVWKEAVERFLHYWNETIGRNTEDVVNFVDFVFQVRKEYRKQKGKAITRNEQFNFQAGISPERRQK